MSETTTATPIANFPGLVAGTWAVDPSHSEVGFTVRHLMSKVRGVFNEYTGTIEIGENVENSKVNVEVELNSVSTRNETRDNHLRSGDFFSTDTNPKMTFVGTSVRPNGDDWVLVGDLTIREVTKPIELEFEFLGVEQNPYGQTVAGFEAKAKINRYDFGVDFNMPGAGERLVIGEKVDIHLIIEAALQA
ncbi:YceI family protein [Kribbella deserti]|uniref:YceI family protein n=1 Tax=Kribbella deserti TaxID=1926257 RepID=A0ABV6QD06_9ACTN